MDARQQVVHNNNELSAGCGYYARFDAWTGTRQVGT